MALIDVGFYKELRHGDDNGPSLHESVGRGDLAVQETMASYLENGTVLAISGTMAYDILSTDQVPSGQIMTQTDGMWLWPGDRAYYVRTHNVSLPAEFVTHARQANWVPCEVSHEELIEFERELFAGQE